MLRIREKKAARRSREGLGGGSAWRATAGRARLFSRRTLIRQNLQDAFSRERRGVQVGRGEMDDGMQSIGDKAIAALPRRRDRRQLAFGELTLTAEAARDRRRR